MSKHIFDIADSAKAAYGAHQCTKEELETKMNSDVVRDNCKKAAEVFASWTEDTPDEETARLKQEAAKYKIKLPVVLPHAHFRDGHRCNASAEESGLMSMDFDHIRDPRAFYEEKIEPHRDELHLMWAFISPTGTGVKTVSAKPQNLTIAEAQAWFAEVIGINDYDHTHDLARCVYLVPSEFNLYYDPQQLFGESAEGATSTSVGREPYVSNGTQSTSAEGAAYNSVGREPYVSNGIQSTSAEGAAQFHTGKQRYENMPPLQGSNIGANGKGSAHALPCWMSPLQGSQAEQSGPTSIQGSQSTSAEGAAYNSVGREPYVSNGNQSTSAEGAAQFHTGKQRYENMPPLQGSNIGANGKDRVDTLSYNMSSLRDLKYDAEARFSGILYSDIARAFWQQKYGKQPQEGMRHQALLDWVREAASICEFSAEKLMQVTPRLGKDDDELARIIQDTLGWKQKNFRPTMPYTLSKVLKELGLNTDECAPSTSVEAFNTYYLERMPKLPPALSAAIKGVDRKYHLAVIYGLLPAFCSFAEKVMYKHCDHSLRRLTLFNFCVGPSSSGKDNVTRRYRALMSKQNVLDVKARDMNDNVRDKNNNKSADEKGNTENEFVKQRALNITNADMLRWMKVSRKNGFMVEGHLLPRKVLMFASEAGIVRKAVKDGGLMVNWRLGFDCDNMAADRASSQAISGDEQVCIDIIALCTPGVLRDLVNSESQEDGTASRLLITFVPGDPFADMPIKEEVSNEDMAIMHEGLDLCSNFEGIIDSPRLRKTLTDWNNNIGKMSEDVNDLKRAMLRRRSCIMGMVAAIVVAILWNKWKDGKLVIGKPAIDFGLLTAEYAMETACAVFDDYAENTKMQYNFSMPSTTRVGKNHQLFDSLPATFTRDDIVNAKPGIKNSAISNIIKRYKEQGLITEVDKMIYKKLNQATI